MPLKMSDYITQMILDALEQNGTASIARNELANQLGCVPSQISYVITSRFTPERGYLVESRRGGGGFIRITRVDVKPENLTMHVVNCIGDQIDEDSCRAILHNLYMEQVITKAERDLVTAAIAGNTLKEVPPNIRDRVRASLFKNIILCL